MKFRIISDLHLDNCPYRDIPPNDPNTVLILAGDVASYYGTADVNAFFQDVANNYSLVLYVPGNHEYYGGKIMHECPFELPDNVILLDNDTYQLDGYNFIGSTLWTSFDNDPLVELTCKMGIRDFTCIYSADDNGYITIDNIKQLHSMALQFISNVHIDNMTNIVITHNSPSYQSLAPQYRNNPLNASYMNSMDSMVESLAPALWVHGHTHASADYCIGSTRVVCNPRGYGQVRNMGLLDQYMNCPTLDMYNKVFRDESNGFDPVLEIVV